MTTICEDSSLDIRVRPKDKAGQPFLPTEMRFKVTNPDTDTELLAYQTFSPQLVSDITVPATVNNITSGQSMERRKVIVEANYSTDTAKVVAKAIYWVREVETI